MFQLSRGVRQNSMRVSLANTFADTSLTQHNLFAAHSTHSYNTVRGQIGIVNFRLFFISWDNTLSSRIRVKHRAIASVFREDTSGCVYDGGNNIDVIIRWACASIPERSRTADQTVDVRGGEGNVFERSGSEGSCHTAVTRGCTVTGDAVLREARSVSSVYRLSSRISSVLQTDVLEAFARWLWGAT